MQSRDETITMNDSIISSVKLKQLLIDLKDHGQHTCVRLRLVGELWQTLFMRVISVAEDRVLLNDETRNKLISVPINAIMQIELDHKFKEYQPHNHYTIQLIKV